jgi:hypothetical protein
MRRLGLAGFFLVGAIVFGLGWTLMMDDDGVRQTGIRDEECLAMVSLDCSNGIASNLCFGGLEHAEAV